MAKDTLRRFPQPQYLGAKYIHREWIAQFIPEDTKTVLDAFGGSQSIAYMLKQLGKQVITNDFMSFNYLIGKALIENNSVTLDSQTVDMLLSPNNNPKEYELMERLYSNLFFTRDEAMFLDAFRSNVSLLGCPYKQALALSIMCRCMTRKVTMGHFAHTKALEYAADPQRVERNRCLTRPLRDIFLDMLTEYNNAVFDNDKDNVSYHHNILDLLPQLQGIDLVYFDPPYCNSHADYQSFYHLLETFVEYWKDKDFINGTRRYEPKRWSGFDKRSEAMDSLSKMFSLSQHIPTWIVSYNDRSYPNMDTMVDMITPYRNVSIEKKLYVNSRGGKGSVKGSNEILLICTNK